jgi:Flp pilus assembly protein TadG
MRAQKSRSESGQILILLAVGFVVLMAFVALALDGGAIYFDRRSAQNAADAAALAGAYQLARDPWDTDTLAARITADSSARVHDNHYGTVDGKTFNVYYPPDSGTIHFVAGDTDVNHYVRVTITSTVNTSFVHLIFPGPIKNTVEAVAHVILPTRGNPFNGSGLVALAPHDCGRLTVGGNVTANLIGGGIFVNSDNASCAADGGSGASFIYSPGMTVVGGISSKLQGSNLIINPGPINSPDPAAAMAYPPDIGIPPVPTCSNAAKKLGTKTVASIPGVTFNEWSEGSMAGFPNGNIYFDPGIFCITINKGGGAGSINNGQYLYNDPNDPTRILLVITGTDPCNLSINGNATLQLKGYGVKPLDGLLFYFDPRTFSKTAEGPLTFNGTSQSYIKGTVYAPTCSIKLNGTGGNFYQGQVIGYEVTMTGTAGINMLYVTGDNLEVQRPAKIDLNQ